MSSAIAFWSTEIPAALTTGTKPIKVPSEQPTLAADEKTAAGDALARHRIEWPLNAGAVTKVPRLPRRSSIPRSISICNALRKVMRLMPKCSARSRSAGIRSVGPNSGRSAFGGIYSGWPVSSDRAPVADVSTVALKSRYFFSFCKSTSIPGRLTRQRNERCSPSVFQNPFQRPPGPDGYEDRHHRHGLSRTRLQAQDPLP